MRRIDLGHAADPVHRLVCRHLDGAVNVACWRPCRTIHRDQQGSGIERIAALVGERHVAALDAAVARDELDIVPDPVINLDRVIVQCRCLILDRLRDLHIFGFGSIGRHRYLRQRRLRQLQAIWNLSGQHHLVVLRRKQAGLELFLGLKRLSDLAVRGSERQLVRVGVLMRFRIRIFRHETTQVRQRKLAIRFVVLVVAILDLAHQARELGFTAFIECHSSSVPVEDDLRQLRIFQALLGIFKALVDVGVEGFHLAGLGAHALDPVIDFIVGHLGAMTCPALRFFR